jgi:hypothetical protein
MTQMLAELLFDHPGARDLAVVELKRLGFQIKLLDYVDEYEGVVLTPTVWIQVRGTYEGSDNEFFAEMMHLAEKFSGDVCEAGYADDQLPQSA